MLFAEKEDTYFSKIMLELLRRYKAQELLRRYAEGERDFSEEDLRGNSFYGKDLAKANFSRANIHGVNFSNTNLTGANFSDAKAGLEIDFYLSYYLISFYTFMSLLSGFCSFFVGVFVAQIFNSSYISSELPITGTIVGLVSLITVTIFCVVTIYEGIKTALRTFAGFGAFVLSLAFFYTVVGTGTFAGTATFAGAATVAGAIAVVGATTAVSAAFLATAVAGAVAVAGASAGASAAVVAATCAAIFAEAVAIDFFPITRAGAGAGTVAGAFTLFSAYIGWRAIKGDEKQAVIRNIAVAFAATSGTSFRGANLTDADFTGAILKNTSLSRATLIRTCWRDTKKLDLADPGNTYLQDSQIRQLLLTGQGQNKNFDNLSLRGINLQGANLQDASFIGTDLNEANLKNADLSRAKLKQTKLDATDFTGATLTGSYIEDWGITSKTNFTGVSCEYVYMRVPTKDNPHPPRKPDNREEVFADGEFGDFIKPIVDTLDLYHAQRANPGAIAISFKELAENNPDAELEIVAMEKRGGDKFLLRVKTAPEADKSELSAEYFDTYNQIKGLPEQAIKLLLAEKDDHIRRLENMVTTALERPSFYTNNYQQGDINMAGDRKIETGGGNYNESGTYNEHIEGDSNRSNYHAAERKQTLAEAAAEIQQLLKQLENSYPTDTTAGKMAIATEAINRIESNPTLAARILSAFKMGSIKGFEQFLSHPAASFVIAALEDWQKTKGS